MSSVALELLRNNLTELNLGFISNYIDTFLHEQARNDKPLVEALCDLLDHEVTQRRQRAAKTRLKLSRLPQIKDLEQFQIEAVEGITRKKLNELASLAFIERKENVVLMGPSGLGKTHILSALVYKACNQGFTAYYMSAQELIEELLKAKRQNRLKRKLASLCKPHLLAIDEIGYESFSREEATLLFNLVASRYEKSSIILTTNKTFGQWGELMGDNAIATATLDRLLHHADVVIMKGESYRIKNRSKLGLVPLNRLSSAKENRK
ncbi:MAG: ATP-binding protein [Smithella sp.]|jgi:DNA replication protein DnaC|nr:ATP-binding protein [Smithella sp.]